MLFGRDLECERIDRLLTGVRAGTSHSLVVTGDPGVGKTSLLRYACRGADGFLVLTTTGTPSDRISAFSGLIQLMRPLVGRVAARRARTLHDAVAKYDEPRSADRFSVYAAALEVLTDAAAANPVLIVVDDLQWVDEPSIEALSFVVRRLLTETIGVLAAGREPGNLTDFEELRLAGLDVDATRRVIESLLPASPAPASVDAVHELFRGNPLAITEQIGEFTIAQLSGLTPIDRHLAPTGAEVFAARLRSLDQSLAGALRIATIAEGDDLATVFAILPRYGVDHQSLQRLEDTGLVAFRDGHVRLRHPLLREAVLAEIPPTIARALHRSLAEAAAGTTHTERRVWHLTESAFGPDESIASELEDMARRTANRTGYSSASTAWERAADLTPERSRRARRLYSAADTAHLAGNPNRAAKLLLAAGTQATNPGLLASIAVTRARLELHRGRPNMARAVWETAAERIVGDAPLIAAMLLTAAGGAAYAAGDAETALRLADEADALAPDVGDVAVPAQLVRGCAATLLGITYTEGYEDTRAAYEFARPRDNPWDSEWLLTAALNSAWIGEWQPARSILDPLIERLRSERALAYLPNALYVSALADSRRGRLAAARTAAAEAVQLAADIGDVLVQSPALGCLALVEAQYGNESAVRSHADAALRIRERADIDDMARDVYDALGLLELSSNNADQAVSFLERANRYASAGPDPVIGRPSSIDLIEAYVHADTAVPEGTREALVQSCEREHFAAIDALLWRARGLLAPDRHVDEFFGRAVAFHALAHSPFDTARTHLCFGERLRRSGRRRDARLHLRTASELFTRLGVRSWLERTGTELTAAGGSPAPATQRLEDLTPQEQQVAQLAARGVTNREIASRLFLSVKTIEMHLGRCYRKLGVRSRTQLANVFLDVDT